MVDKDNDNANNQVGYFSKSKQHDPWDSDYLYCNKLPITYASTFTLQ